MGIESSQYANNTDKILEEIAAAHHAEVNTSNVFKVSSRKLQTFVQQIITRLVNE